MEETELQLVRVLELGCGPRTSHSRAHVLYHHTPETRKSCWMNEWLWEMKVDICWLSGGKLGPFGLIWANLALQVFLVSVTLVQHLASYHFLPPASAKDKNWRQFKPTHLGTFPALTHWRCESDQHGAPRMKAIHFHYVESHWWALSIPSEGRWSPWGSDKRKLEKFLALLVRFSQSAFFVHSCNAR